MKSKFNIFSNKILFLSCFIYTNYAFAIEEFNFKKDPTNGKDVSSLFDGWGSFLGKTVSIILIMFMVIGVVLTGTSLYNLYDIYARNNNHKSGGGAIVGIIVGGAMIGIPVIMFYTSNTVTGGARN